MEVMTSGSTAFVSSASADIAITADGSRVVYRGVEDLLVRNMDQLEPKALTGLGFPRNPFVSPDGQWVGFFDAGATLKKIAITGGAPVTIAQAGAAPRGATWGPEGTIIYATTGSDTGLQSVSAGAESHGPDSTQPRARRERSSVARVPARRTRRAVHYLAS